MIETAYNFEPFSTRTRQPRVIPKRINETNLDMLLKRKPLKQIKMRLTETGEYVPELNLRTVVIRITPNNFMITILDADNKVIRWTSRGHQGERRHKYLSLPTLEAALSIIVRRLKREKCDFINIIIKGKPVRSTRKLLYVFTNDTDLQIHHVKLTTPIPHNGCRLPKRRRK